MKLTVPVHVSLDLEVHVSVPKRASTADVARAAEEAAEKKLQRVFGAEKFSGQGRAKASPRRARTERGQLVFGPLPQGRQRRPPVAPESSMETASPQAIADSLTRSEE